MTGVARPDETEVVARAIGDMLHAARGRGGMTVAEAAERCDVDAPLLRRYETAKGTPSLITLRRVVVGLGIGPDEFVAALGWWDDPSRIPAAYAFRITHLVETLFKELNNDE